MNSTNNYAPEAQRKGRRANQRRSSGAIEDPTKEFFRRHSKEYEAFEQHAYAISARVLPRQHAASDFRGDVSSDEAFFPLNFGLRGR